MWLMNLLVKIVKKMELKYDETDDDFEAEVKDDCLTIVYRLLFIFYAESQFERKFRC